MSRISSRPVLLAFLLAGLASCATPQSAAPPMASATPPAASNAISWDAAKNHVGETVTITGPVAGTHTTRDGSHLSLNIGKDFPDPTRFVAYLDITKADPAAATESFYQGKTITITGKVVIFQNVPQIKAAPSDVRIQK